MILPADSKPYGCQLLASFETGFKNESQHNSIWKKINWDPEMATEDLMMHFWSQIWMIFGKSDILDYLC